MLRSHGVNGVNLQRATVSVEIWKTVDLAFATKSLRHICENHSKARRFFGETIASQLKNRLADLDAAETTADLVAGSPRVLTSEPPGQLAIMLCDGYSLLVAAADAPIPCTGEGAVNWMSVSRVKVLKIEKI